MKRTAIALAAAALLAPALVFAQSVDITINTQDTYVLDKAREEYNEGSDSSAGDTTVIIVEAPVAAPAEPSSVPEAASTRPFIPMVLHWVPGVGTPMGVYDTNLAAGALGSLVGTIQGIQASTIFSIAEGSVEGVQISGVFNIAGVGVEGFQAGGVFNISGGQLEGFQAAGTFNIVGAAVEGFQGAGVFNIAGGSVDGFQGAGVFNVAGGKVDGFQGAGVLNVAAELDGVQSAGVVNVAGEAKGLMIAPINIAKSLDGVALGLLNFIGDGVNELGVEYAPDLDLFSAVWRNGTRSLYWLVRLSVPAEDLDGEWDKRAALSVGLGSRLRLSRDSWVDLDLSAERSFDAEFRAAYDAAVAADDCQAFWDALSPYPSIGLTAGGNIGPLVAWFGVRADIDLVGVAETSERWREEGGTWSGSFLDVDYVARPRLVFGLAF